MLPVRFLLLSHRINSSVEGVDPDAGYTRTLLDISNRSLNCNKVLLAEVDSSTKQAPLQQSAFSFREFLSIFPPAKSRRFEGFL